MDSILKLLLVADADIDAELIWQEIKKINIAYKTRLVSNKVQFLQGLKSFQPDIIIFDSSLSQFEWKTGLFLLNELTLFIPIILLTDSIDEEIADEYLKAGVYDYILKDNLSRLSLIVHNSIAKIELQREKKTIAEELNKSELRFHKAQSIALIGNWELDLSGKTVWCSEEALRIYGFEKESHGIPLGVVLKSPLLEYRAILVEVLDRLLKYNEPYEFEFKIRRANDSSIRSIYSRAELVPAYDGKQVKVIGIIQDITERKESEEAVNNERRTLRTLIDNLPDMVYVKDFDCRKVIANVADVNNIGFEKEEDVLGKTELELFPGQIGARGYADDQKIINSGEEIIGREEDFINSRGIRRWLLTSKFPLFDEIGKITGIVGISHDITERKLAEEIIIESEERYKRITESLTDYLYTAIVKDGAVVETIHHDACKVVTGYSSKEFRTDPNLWINMIVPEDREWVVHEFQKIFKKIELPPIEHRLIRKDGEIRWICNTVIPKYDASGNLVSYDGIIKDITERKQAEEKIIIANKKLAFENKEKDKRAAELAIANEEKDKHAAELIIANKELAYQNEEKEKWAAELIKAKEKAEESDRLKSAFLTNVSHEIRTPMNGILGFTELLKEPNLTSDDLQDYIQIIQISGARMLSTINNIVDVSKIESGLMKVDIKETNINEKMEFTYKFFKPEIEIKGLQFLLKNSLPSKESIINTDSEKVCGILINLVRNAIRFTYKGSIEFGYVKKGEYLEFFVKDTGIGIPQEKKQLIFERFRQGSESDSRGYEGSGLGLSISKSYVEMLGGKIWVESEEEKGSIFYFTIPYNFAFDEKKAIRDTVPGKGKEVEIKPLKILVAEDDETSNFLLIKMLKNISNNILIAKTGVETITSCHNNPDIDLVLMDIKMPNMDGSEATRRIRKFNKDVIIIAQTACAFSGDKEKAIEAGCNDYISKPIDKTLLYELIKKYFNN